MRVYPDFTRPHATLDDCLAAGLFAGRLSALGHALAGPEVSITFVAIWSSPGIAFAGVPGAFLGPRVLRW